MQVASNVIIIHGCPSNPENHPATRTYDKHWIPWAKMQLMEKGLSVETPIMPEPWKPNYEAFQKEFEKYSVDENTILIGHSCGSAFLVKWLGEKKQKIKKLILVAPWKIPDETDGEERKKFYSYSIDETIRSRVNEIVIFTADNEEEDGKKSVQLFHAALGGKIIELKGRGHYVFRDMGTSAFPELIHEVLFIKN